MNSAASGGARRVVHDEAGLNTGVWPAAADELVTPVREFFTRSHAPIPRIDLSAWRLELDGLVERPARISLEELRARFPMRRVTATVICAGLRRDEFLALGPLPGELPWGPEAAGTGQWGGVPLREVLLAAGVAERDGFVEFTGLDRVERRGDAFGFGGSIPLAKAFGEEVLLAWELNGEPLTPAHGAPLRAIVPGWIGARSVKWLGRITVRADPSPNYFQTRAYRLQREVNPADPLDVTAGEALGPIPLNAVILDPVAHRIVPAGPVRVRGWAVGTGGQAVTRVELSADGGGVWQPARITRRAGQWAWCLWDAMIDVPRGPAVLVARAADASGAEQPAEPGSTWNVKGYCNNAWHRVPVTAG